MDTTTQPQPAPGQLQQPASQSLPPPASRPLPPPPPSGPAHLAPASPPPPPPPPESAPMDVVPPAPPQPPPPPRVAATPSERSVAQVGPGAGCVLPSSSGVDVRRLLVERAALADRLIELDAAAERLTRSVQRVGGPTQGSRPFSGKPPLRVASAADLEQQIDRLNGEMHELTATISEQELQLHDMDRPSRRRRAFRILLVLVVVAAAAAAAVYLAVR